MHYCLPKNINVHFSMCNRGFNFNFTFAPDSQLKTTRLGIRLFDFYVPFAQGAPLNTTRWTKASFFEWLFTAWYKFVITAWISVSTIISIANALSSACQSYNNGFVYVLVCATEWCGNMLLPYNYIYDLKKSTKSVYM